MLRLEGEMIYFYAMLQKQPEKEVEKNEQDKQASKDYIRKDIPYQVYEMKNDVKDSTFKFKAFVFHCATQEEIKSIKQIKLVGSRLVRTSEVNFKNQIFISDLKIEKDLLKVWKPTEDFFKSTKIDIASFIDNSGLSIDIIPE